MSRRTTTAAALLLLAAAGLAPAARAGQACEQKPADAQAVSEGMALAVATATAPDASGANVVMLPRAGQDLSDYRLAYSHLGFAYRADSTTWTAARGNRPPLSNRLSC